jgi:hypothetical protein
MLIFSAGAVFGATVSWMYIKKKYEEILDEQIELANEELEAERERVVELEEREKQAAKCAIDEYRGVDKSDGESKSGPYVITPEELGEIDEYDTTTLYYYADEVLVNLNDEVVEDVEGTVGLDFAEHFGEYEDDSVCIRNEAHMCDYEILREPRFYADIVRERTGPQDTEE